MSQFISFDAPSCFNEIGEWLCNLRRFRPPTFSDYYGKADTARGPRLRCSDWPKLREQFQAEYATDPDGINRAFCETLDEWTPYVMQQGWLVTVARANRIALFLNNGDVHALRTHPDWVWEKLPRLWDRFNAIREEAGLCSSTPPWRKSGKCVLPLVSDSDLTAFEGDVLELADEFDLMRDPSGLHFEACGEEWEHKYEQRDEHGNVTGFFGAWILPNYSEHVPRVAYDTEQTCDFEFVPIPCGVIIDHEIWHESRIRYYDYLKCKKCGTEQLCYRLPWSPSVIAYCNPDTREALEWQVQREDRLFRALFVFRRSWGSLAHQVRLQRYPEDHPDSECSPSGEPKEAVRVARTFLLEAERTLVEIAAQDSRAEPLLPLVRDLAARDPNNRDADFSDAVEGEHDLFRREKTLLTAAIPVEDLAAIRPPVESSFGWDDIDGYKKWLELPKEERFPHVFTKRIEGEQSIPVEVVGGAAAVADRAESVESGNGANGRRGMSREEANYRARGILRENPNITVRELASRIGCSTGLVSQLTSYRVVRERLDSDAQPKKPKTVSLSDDLLAMTGRDDEALKRLIEEQEADSEPSPLEDDESRKPNRVFRPK